MTTSSIPGLNQAGSGVLSTRGASYGDNPFLSLLIAEMRTQSPLDPVDNASFMQQMSSFSSMQEQKQLNDNMLKLLDYQGVLARLQGLSEGSALLGNEVSWTDGSGNEQKGTVEAVFVDDDGNVKLRVGEQEIDMRRITGIVKGSGS
jgi:flagellar basal-body rod modification protein FlgD